MRQLSGIDADLLYVETPEWHMHVGGVVVVDPSTIEGPYGYDEWRALIQVLVARLPALRERLDEVPLGLGRPFWVEDPDFDLDAHLHRATVPEPGRRAELASLVGTLSESKLDHRRPLWEAWYLDGLEGGRLATLFKVHHAIMDGVGGALLMGHMFSLEPEPVPPVSEPHAPAGERIPSGPELLARSLVSLATIPVHAARSAARTISSFRHLIGRGPAGEDAGPAARPFRAPRTFFNQEVTAHRSVAFASIPLDEVKQVRRSCDATVNDVVLAVCAGALRRWLVDRDELPGAPLVAAVPVSTRSPQEMDQLGNRVSGWFVNLPTAEPDPIERLSSVRAAANGAKGLYDTGIEDAVIDWADVPLPVVLGTGVRLYHALHLSRSMPPIFNLLISNVRGTDVPLYAGGAEVEAIYPLGPVLDTIGLNITVLSYRGSVDFGIVSCPELAPDLEDFAAAITAELEELVATVATSAQVPR